MFRVYTKKHSVGGAECLADCRGQRSEWAEQSQALERQQRVKDLLLNDTSDLEALYIDSPDTRSQRNPVQVRVQLLELLLTTPPFLRR